MAIKSVQAIVNGVTTTLTYDSKSKTYKATLTAPAKSSYNQSGHYYGVQIIAKDEAGNPRYKSTGYLRCFIGTEPGGCRSNLCNFCFGNRLGGAAWQLTYW